MHLSNNIHPFELSSRKLAAKNFISDMSNVSKIIYPFQTSRVCASCHVQSRTTSTPVCPVLPVSPVAPVPASASPRPQRRSAGLCPRAGQLRPVVVARRRRPGAGGPTDDRSRAAADSGGPPTAPRSRSGRTGGTQTSLPHVSRVWLSVVRRVDSLDNMQKGGKTMLA